MIKTSSETLGFWHRAVRLYADGFRQMTWGRVLWALILVKLFILFFVLRLFFFTPFLQGDDAAKQEAVGQELIQRGNIHF
jgi:hypothetical protein